MTVTSAGRLRALHRPGQLLVVPNAWDAMSARTLVAAGARTIATSSSAVAWTLGYADGEQAPWDAWVAATRRICRAVDVPVTVDLESGWARASGGIALSVAAVLSAGAAGINLEDGSTTGPHRLVDVAAHSERIMTARVAADRVAVPLFINARTDVFWRQVGEPETRVHHALDRLRRYAAAGADGAFCPGVYRTDDIARLVDGLDVPLNLMFDGRQPPLAELADLGVARLTFGAGLLLAATATIESIAAQMARGDLGALQSVGRPSRSTLAAAGGGRSLGPGTGAESPGDGVHEQWRVASS
jgi:2-methylisocitrate lyase-like PEP mutase family enzyme